jgi:hypothetical protein
MDSKRVLIALAAAGLITGAATADDKSKEKTTPAAAAQEVPPLPQPGPEHQVMKDDVGTWDATVEAFMAPEAPPAVSKGTETNRLTAGGLWLVSDFKSEFMGQPFEGHGVMGWDPAKKKYVGTWVDSMTTTVSQSESTYDAATKTFTGWMEGPDETGKTVKTKAVTQLQSPDSKVFTMYRTIEGKEVPTLRITYTRRK